MQTGRYIHAAIYVAIARRRKNYLLSYHSKSCEKFRDFICSNLTSIFIRSPFLPVSKGQMKANIGFIIYFGQKKKYKLGHSRSMG